MKVKLVNGIFNKRRISEPIGICSIAAVLRQNGHAVEILEPRIEGHGVHETVEEILATESGILGVSTFSFQRTEILQMIGEVRERGYAGMIILGGLGPTLNRDAYFEECKHIDAVVLGEGELTLLDIASCLEREQRGEIPPQSWKNVPGVAFRNEQGAVQVNRGRRRIANLDELPFMARDVLKRNIEKYGTDVVFAPIMAGRGCYKRCSYCWIAAALDLQEGERYRQRSVSNVLDEVELLIREYGVRRFSFEDDNFITPGCAGINRALEFRDEVKRRGLKFEFFFQTRPDTISREALLPYKEAGLAKLFIGIETIAEQDMDLYGKSCTLERIAEVLTLLKDMGYDTDLSREHQGRLRFGYITFNPLTTLESFRKSLRFFREFKLTPKRLVTQVNLFDGDMDIKRAYAERGFEVKDSREIVFAHPEVGLLYRTLKSYSQRVFSYREQIRSIEKHAARKGISNEEIAPLTFERECLDEMVLTFSGRLLELLEDPRCQGDSQEREVGRLLKSELDAVEHHGEERNLLDRVRIANEKYGADPGMYDMYW
jgi:radical SAM superfamily enzyme YgiQ (UPF0313 family)